MCCDVSSDGLARLVVLLLVELLRGLADDIDHGAIALGLIHPRAHRGRYAILVVKVDVRLGLLETAVGFACFAGCKPKRNRFGTLLIAGCSGSA